jgi:hypothetical protein
VQPAAAMAQLAAMRISRRGNRGAGIGFDNYRNYGRRLDRITAGFVYLLLNFVRVSGSALRGSRGKNRFRRGQ